MGIRIGLLLMLLATAAVRAQAGQDATRVADGYAYLSGFGEGVAAVLVSSAPAAGTRVVQGFNGKLTLKTYRQPGIELLTASGGERAYPASLTISRANQPLPLGLRIGATRGAVEDLLGPLPAKGDKLVLKRAEGYGCDDPIVLSFRGKVLTQVAWTWESCND